MNTSTHRWTVPVLATALLSLGGFARAEELDTMQERIAQAWIEAHNAHDADTMAAFRAKHFQRSTVKDWQPNYYRMVEDLGTLEVYGVMIDGDGRLMVGVRPSKRDDRVRLVFKFHEDAPDQIAEIGLNVGSGPGGGRSGHSKDDGLPSLTLEDDWKRRKPAIDAYLRGLAESGGFSGNVLIAENGRIRFEGAYGLASREFGVPNDLDTRFDVGSINKDYTRLAIVQLEQRGLLSQDDTVGRHLPDYPNPTVRDRVTIRQLLEHTSGLGDYFDEDWWQTPMSSLRHVEDYIPIWGPKPLVAEPGKQQRYSNFGYTVLGAIIEKVSGQRYPDYVQEHVFEPAGMSRSGFFDTDAVVPNVAVGYTHMNRGERLEQPIKNIYVEPAKGGPWGKSYSTVRDLYRFYDAMLAGRLVEGDANWLAGGWRTAGWMLGGAGPGLNAMVSLEEGVMVIVAANMDPPIASAVATKLSDAIRR